MATTKTKTTGDKIRATRLRNKAIRSGKLASVCRDCGEEVAPDDTDHASSAWHLANVEVHS